MSEIKNYVKSIRTRLLNVAKQNDVFYQAILTRYFQERLLYRNRISQTPLSHELLSERRRIDIRI